MYLILVLIIIITIVIIIVFIIIITLCGTWKNISSFLNGNEYRLLK